MKNKFKILAISTTLFGVMGGIASCDNSGSDNSGSVSNQTSNSTSGLGNYVLTGVEQKESFTKFSNNKNKTENNNFMNLTNNYLVGDDNYFDVRPKLKFLDTDKHKPVSDEIALEITEKNYSFTISLEEIKNGISSPVNIERYTDNVDSKSAKINFSENAIGKSFRINVTPNIQDTASVSSYKKSFDVDVIDGFNVYNAKELAYFNKNRTDDFKEAWDTFMKDNQLNDTNDKRALIIHDDINVTTSDIPSKFFYSEEEVKGQTDYGRALGSLKDYTNIYRHVFTEENEKFDFYGNYFKLDASSLPLVTREDNKVTAAGSVISHACLLRTDRNSDLLPDEKKDTVKFLMQDFNLIGNASRQENDKLGGGLIFHKNEKLNCLLSNNVARCWFITYFTERRSSNYVIEKNYATDNFNSFIYNWGGNITIDSCEMSVVGGPIIIQDHVSPSSENSSFGTTTIKNSHLENWVTGKEGWFNLVGAGDLPLQITGLNALFSPYNRSFLKDNKFNFICVTKSGEGIKDNSPIKGSVKIDDIPAFDYGETDSAFKTFYTTASSLGAPVIESSSTEANRFAFIEPPAIKYVSNIKDGKPVFDSVPQGHPVLSGDYLALYYLNMQLVLGYFPATTTPAN